MKTLQDPEVPHYFGLHCQNIGRVIDRDEAVNNTPLAESWHRGTLLLSSQRYCYPPFLVYATSRRTSGPRMMYHRWRNWKRSGISECRRIAQIRSRRASKVRMWFKGTQWRRRPKDGRRGCSCERVQRHSPRVAAMRSLWLWSLAKVGRGHDHMRGIG